jgi:hypothetical protein
MTEEHPPEDPIWSRWRQRHGPGNGAPPREAPPEPEPVRLGDPLDPEWDKGTRAKQEPPPPRTEPPRTEPRGFEARAAHGAHGEHECLEWCPICRTADIVRHTFPPEVRSQLEDVQRDALVAIRTILDHYIDRLDGHERPASRVEDIPIS